MNTQPLGFGLIGAGSIGRFHAQTLAHRLPGVRLVAVCDPFEEAGRAVAELAGARWTPDAGDLVADPAVQAVVIAAPSAAHADLIEKAAAAGKHIFCEKPVAIDLPATDAALAAVERAGVALQVGFQRRFDPAYQRARQMIAAGDIGAIELVVCTTRDPEPPATLDALAAGNLYVDCTIHDFDALRYLTGMEAVEVFASGGCLVSPALAATGDVDTSAVTLRLENGALAVITNSRRAAYGYDVTADVMGSKGKLVIGGAPATDIYTYTAAGVCRDHFYWYLDRFRQAYIDELGHFVRCLRDGLTPEPTGADGRAALVLALSAARSLREGRPVPVAG